MAMLKIMKIMAAGDTWLEGRVEALLLWLEEWFSVSQKWAERGTMAVYIALILVPRSLEPAQIGLKLGLALLVGSMMWFLHRKPEAVRRLARRDPMFGVVRAVIAAFMVFLSAEIALMPPHNTATAASGLAQVVYLVFFYMTDITSGGECGRKRKLALEELKKMFGDLAWIPKPAQVPG
jgi:hypothetical protein